MLKLLVIEDDAEHCDLIASALSCLDGDEVDLTFAHSVEEGCNLIDVLRFHAVVLDHNLPDGLGTDVLQRQQHRLLTVPVIGLSTSRDPQVALADFRGGCVEFVSKHDAFEGHVLRDRLLRAVQLFNRRKIAIKLDQGAKGDVLDQIEGLIHSSRMDALTGICNRAAFNDCLAQWHASAEQEAERVAFCMIDIDNFKKYNDTYGHPAGDRTLRSVAQALRQGLRERDFIARYGGEEIAVLLADVAEGGNAGNGAMRIAARLRRCVEQLAIVHERNDATHGQGQVTISLGVAIFEPGRGESAEQLMERADAALYQAKRQGRNRAVSATGFAAGPGRTHCLPS